MSVASVLAPVFVQVALCYGLLFGLIALRNLAAPGLPADDAWLVRSRRVSASYANQFEMPVLFFAAVPLALATHQADGLFVALEWIYVVARLAQAAVHVTVNIVILRGACFFVSALVLGFAWIRLAFGLLAGG